MQTHTILIISGTLLLLAGVIGGGLSLKEIKLPSLDKYSRALASFVGISLIVAGIYIESHDPHPDNDASSSVSNSSPGIEQDRDQSIEQRTEEQRLREEQQRQADSQMAALQWRADYEAQGGQIIPIGEFEQRHNSSRLFEVAEHRFTVRACPDCDFGFVFQCRTPVSSIDELKQLKVRAHNEIFAAGIQPIVGDVAVFPASETFQALQAGVIDCYCSAVRL